MDDVGTKINDLDMMSKIYINFHTSFEFFLMLVTTFLILKKLLRIFKITYLRVKVQ
jgi:hypothetical protein